MSAGCVRCGRDLWDKIHDTRKAFDFTRDPPESTHDFMDSWSVKVPQRKAPDLSRVHPRTGERKVGT